MNATLQTMRAIPELGTALAAYTGDGALARALRDVYASMDKTTDGFIPVFFLQVRRPPARPPCA